jgi:hypothetical protein
MQYLLGLVCTFSGWVDTSPTWAEEALEVVRCLLKGIISQFGIPVLLGQIMGQPLWHRWYSWWLRA